jgi:hypothetical protein
MPAPKGHKRYGGRVKGTPNRATTDGRIAVADFVNSNADRLQGWLDQIAEGVPELDDTGAPKKGRFIIKPDPEKAFNMVRDLLEYHVPKLARSEVKLDGEIAVSYVAHMPAPVKDADDWLERSK